MDSYSRIILSNVFEEIIGWRRRKDLIPDQVKFHWNELHLSVVQGFVLNSGLNPGSRLLTIAKLLNDTLWDSDPESSIVYAKMVASFTQLLQPYFIVPKQHQFFDTTTTIKKNELVAAFINFLLQLLCSKIDYSYPFRDRVDGLEKELKFLLTVVEDTLLQCDENEQVQDLLAKIEAAANQAGTSVHSFFFSKNQVFKTMDEGFGDTSKQIELLKGNITKFLDLSPFINQAYVSPKTSTVDSSLIVHSLLYDLDDLLNQDDIIMIADSRDLIKTLQQGLILFQSHIKEMGAPQQSETEELKKYVMRIGDVAYEAEYLITSLLDGDAPLWYFLKRLSYVIHKIKLIETGIQEIKKNHDSVASSVEENLSEQLSSQGKGNSEVNDIAVGLEDIAINILDQLVGGAEQRQIISMYGMPGLGKTTLAKRLYNHPSISYWFDRRLWCVISQRYNRQNILIEILINLTSELDRSEILKKGDEGLVEEIHKSLKGRRYLLVLDDIWSANVWDDLLRCLPDDGNGSRILFTTRNKDSAPLDCISHGLPFLSNEQCWELLEKKVFHNKSCPPKLLSAGKEIAKKCCGLPLTIVVIAGVLSALNKEETTWKKVEASLASYIFPNQNNSTMHILELSFEHLPKHLKPCFLYFQAFVEYTEIPVRKLMRLWVAEGFIRKQEKKSSESLAEEYLMELINKSLVMVAKRRSDGGVKTCIVHDLLLDLCLKRCREENFLTLVDNNNSVYVRGCRLLSCQQSLSPFGKHVRSFHGYLPEAPFYFVNMKLLRVLNFLESAPKLIGAEFLVRLRYLVIHHLPASITGSLVNLEYLCVVRGVDGDDDDDDEIPFAILKMVKLRYLHLNGIAFFGKDCNSSHINNLEVLSRVHIRELKNEEMLKCSPHLHKLKCECEALWVEEKEVFRYPNLNFVTQLESLNMVSSRPKMENMHVAPPDLPSSIKKLTLSGLRLPWEKMSVIGRLPNLQVLKLLKDAFVGEIWETGDGEFPQLTFLKLEGLHLLQWTVPFNEHFPRLRQLVLNNCANLQQIPSEMGEIATLQLIEVERKCEMSLLKSAQKIELEQQGNGNEELRFVTRVDRCKIDKAIEFENLYGMAHEEHKPNDESLNYHLECMDPFWAENGNLKDGFGRNYFWA